MNQVNLSHSPQKDNSSSSYESKGHQQTPGSMGLPAVLTHYENESVSSYRILTNTMVGFIFALSISGNIVNMFIIDSIGTPHL